MVIELKDIKNKLESDDIIEILSEFFHVDTHVRKEGVVLFPTVCHNINPNEASLKLYYYEDSKKFHCYTECGDTFDIFDLIQRRFKLLQKPYYFYDDIVYPIADRINYNFISEEQYQSIHSKYIYKEQKTEIPIKSSNVLAAFSNQTPVQWLKDGITKETMEEFGIRFSLADNKIVIPHYNINSELVGIRSRNLNDEEIINFGKYTPMKIQGEWYSHPLSLNLYGLNKSKENIKKIQKAIVFESEKSVMLYHQHYPNGNIAVAVCGSSFNKIQMTMLLQLGVNEIVLAFDREYESYPSNQSDKYFDKLKGICDKYKNYTQMSFIFDTKNLLGYKDSPIDKTKDIFEQLIKERVK